MPGTKGVAQRRGYRFTPNGAWKIPSLVRLETLKNRHGPGGRLLAWATGFGHVLPPGKTIDGVCVRATSPGGVTPKTATAQLYAGKKLGHYHRLGKGWPPRAPIVLFGGAGDLWRAALTPEVVVSPTFGVTVALAFADLKEARHAAVEIAVFYH